MPHNRPRSAQDRPQILRSRKPAQTALPRNTSSGICRIEFEQSAKSNNRHQQLPYNDTLDRANKTNLFVPINLFVPGNLFNLKMTMRPLKCLIYFPESSRCEAPHAPSVTIFTRPLSITSIGKEFGVGGSSHPTATKHPSAFALFGLAAAFL